MRVLTFLHSFELGGVERIALRLVRAWREDGMDAPLFMGREDGPLRQDAAHGLFWHGPRQPPFSTAGSETLWMILTLPACIRRVRPDLLFCAGNSYTVVAVAMKLLLGQSCPPIVAKISNDLARKDLGRTAQFFYGLWLRIQGRMIDHFIGMESPMADEIAAAMGVNRARISIVANPALSQRQIETIRAVPARRERHDPRERRFVAVGRLVKQKNFDMMLRAFASASHPGDRLTILGEGPERARLEALAEELGIGARVSMPGHVPDPAAMLPAFDILLLSSFYEGVPAAILEALAAGLPIIATDCCTSMRALLRDGRLGQIVEPGDEESFANAIARAMPGVQDQQGSLEQAMRFTIERASQAYRNCFGQKILALD
jgi:glycosyltransferase involved in cell wall biosynthesis